MNQNRWTLLGVILLLTVATVSVIKWTQRSPKVVRTPEQVLADSNSKQLAMLAKHRDLFEAVAKGDAERTKELRRTINIDFSKAGNAFKFSWHDGGGALFGCDLVLIYCPNGEADLETVKSTGPRTSLMRIDEHWFACKENCG